MNIQRSGDYADAKSVASYVGKFSTMESTGGR
jgi:hypothetical protein